MEIIPYATSHLYDRTLFMGFLMNPPLVWSVTAQDMHSESGSWVNTSSYNKSLGELYGHPIASKNGICLTMNSTTYPNAITFDPTGTMIDTWASPDNGTTGLLMVPSTDTIIATQHTPFDTLPALRFTVHMTGVITAAPGDYGMAIQISPYLRLLVSMQQPIGVQLWDGVTKNASTSWTTGWNTVAMLSDNKDAQNYIIQNNNQVSIDLLPCPEDNTIIFKVNNEPPIVWAIDPTSDQWNNDPNSPTYNSQAYDPIANPQVIFFVYKSGWATVEMETLTFSNISVTKQPYNLGAPHPNADAITFAINATSNIPSEDIGSGSPPATGQYHKITPNFTDKTVGFTADVGRGDGLPPRLRDVTAIIPANWKFFPSTIGTNYSEGRLNIEAFREKRTFDDINRILTVSGHIVLNNYDGIYTGMAGSYLLENTMSLNMDGMQTFARGLMVVGAGKGGWSSYGSSANAHVSAAYEDLLSVLDTAISIEVICDGWYVYSAVRCLCELGSMHPMFLQNVPYYIPPGANQYAPYGPAGNDLPEDAFVLGRGTGLNPRYRFTPEMTARQCLMQILKDLGTPDPNTGRVIPWYMGMDFTNQLFFGPYDPLSQISVATFLDMQYDNRGWNVAGDGSGPFPIIGEIQVSSDTSNLRTEVVFEGRNAFTNELMVERRVSPDYVIAWKGQRSAWVERSGRWATSKYLKQVADNASVKASIASTLIQWKSVAVPWLSPTMIVCIVEQGRYGGSGYFVITEMDFTVGCDSSGKALFECTYTGRNVLSYY